MSLADNPAEPGLDENYKKDQAPQAETQVSCKRPAEPYPARGQPAECSGGIEWSAIARAVTTAPTAPVCFLQASRADGLRGRLAVIQKTGQPAAPE